MSSAIVHVVTPTATVQTKEPQGGGVAEVFVSEEERLKDAMDTFNHPRLRRMLIVQALQKRHDNAALPVQVAFDESHSAAKAAATTPSEHTQCIQNVYRHVHSDALIEFLTTAGAAWHAKYHQNEHDEIACHPQGLHLHTPPLIPIVIPLHRVPNVPQRPSPHVLGQIGYYCTDLCTPVFDDLLMEIGNDAAMLDTAVQKWLSTSASTNSEPAAPVVYVLPTHPGHHAATDCYGGYCYLNHVAAAAALALQSKQHERVAILDVDYHCGNGTAAIFQDRADVLVVSLHCDPVYDYPFHTGYADDVGTGAGAGYTMHIPLPPGTAGPAYQVALEQALARIREYAPTALIVSLGLDTYDQDPCALRRAGFTLHDEDYVNMGRAIARGLSSQQIPVLFVQEGGYRMERVGDAAADVVCSFAAERYQQAQNPSSATTS